MDPLIVVFGPALLSVVVTRLFKAQTYRPAFYLATLILPGLTFFGGLALFAYFLIVTASTPPGTLNGGDGPAFFGVIFVAFILPVLLIVPGLLSGLIAKVLFEGLAARSERIKGARHPTDSKSLTHKGSNSKRP